MAEAGHRCVIKTNNIHSTICIYKLISSVLYYDIHKLKLLLMIRVLIGGEIMILTTHSDALTHHR